MANKPLLVISKGLNSLIDEANKTAETAEEKILEAYKYAVEVDGMEPKAAAKLLKQRLTYSPQWINKFLPEEAKQVHVSAHERKLKPVSTNSDTIKKGPINPFWVTYIIQFAGKKIKHKLLIDPVVKKIIEDKVI